ncbi:MAG: hypothetical protein ACREM1_10835 [Longimicrobiales bacterium]
MNGRTITRHSLMLTFAAALAGCGSGESASAQDETERVSACDLVSKADIEAVIGAPVAEPSDFSSGAGGSLMSSCAYDTGVVVRAWNPYRSGESTSGAWAAKLEAEREKDAAKETDPEMKELRAALTAKLQPIDDLGAPAALEDLREQAGQVALHVYASGKGGVNFSIYATDLETARALTMKALQKLR